MKALMCLHRHDHQQNHQNPKVKLQSQSRQKNQKRYRKFIIIHIYFAAYYWINLRFSDEQITEPTIESEKTNREKPIRKADLISVSDIEREIEAEIDAKDSNNNLPSYHIDLQELDSLQQVWSLY